MKKTLTRLSAFIASTFLLQTASVASVQAPGYCSPTVTNNGLYLEHFQFDYSPSTVTGGVKYMSTGNSGYTSNVSSSSGTIKRGCGTTVWLTSMTSLLNTAVDFRITIYGDWNNDGDFADANEMSGYYENTIPNNGGFYISYNTTFYVPENAVTGNVRMRYILSSKGVTPNPCGPISGEVQDFLFTVAANTAPVLNTSANPILNNINTAQTNLTGIKVKSLIASSEPSAKLITDADGCPSYALAITGTTGAGTWQYLKTTGSWTNMGTVSVSNALLLRDSSSIRYVPSGVETATITLKAWDKTTGTDGTYANATGGTTTAFSTSSITVNQVVVADASYTSQMTMLSYGNPNKLVSAPFDRTNKLITEPAVLQNSSTFGYCTDLELDETSGKVYWSGTGTTGVSIYSSNADGTNPTEAIVASGWQTGLAINNGSAYFLQYEGLFSADLAGTNITAISGGANQLDNADIYDVKDVDYYNNKIYFVYQSANDNKWHIKECNLDGTVVVDKYSSSNTIYALDVTGGNLYWSETDANSDAKLYKRTIASSGVGTLLGTLVSNTIFQLKSDETNNVVYASTYESNGVSKIYKISTAGGSFSKILDLDFVAAGLTFSTVVVATPTFSATATLSSFKTCSGSASSPQTIAVTGTDLTNNIAVTAPEGYEVSTSQGSGFASTLSLTPTLGTLSSTTVFIRMTSSATTSNGDILFTSTGASNHSLAVSGVVNQPSTTSLTKTACGSYLFDGISRTTTGTYSANLTNKAGCDSIVTLNLTINKVNTTVELVGGTLNAVASTATYQWLDCDNNYSVIDGATDRFFTPTTTGNYAVIITENGCSDTSDCKNVSIVTSVSDSQTSTLSVYPNPATEVVNVTLPSSINGGVVSISDIHGNEVVSKSVSGLEFSISTSDLSSGVYILKVSSSTLTATKQIVVVK